MARKKFRAPLAEEKGGKAQTVFFMYLTSFDVLFFFLMAFFFGFYFRSQNHQLEVKMESSII